MVARILVVASDLMLASRAQESLWAAGYEVQVSGALPEEISADAIVCDLDAVDAAAVAAAETPSLGFYSHVEVETRKQAEKAGIDVVVPRSRMARELPDLVERLLAG